jgi:lambda family phage tail tape measure protein
MATPEQMQILITARTADAVKDVERLARSLDNVSTKVVPNTANALGNMGRKAGAAGIQFQQLVGQVQGGVKPMVAISQQAADLGFVLGFPLAGAVAGIAASLAGPFVSALIGSSESTADLAEKIRDLEGSYKDLTQAEKNLLEFQVALERQNTQKIIRGINEEIEKLTRSFAEIQDLSDIGMEQFAEDTGGAQEALLKLRANLSLYQRDLADLDRQTGLLNGTISETNDESKKQGDIAGKSSRKIVESQKQVINKYAEGSKALNDYALAAADTKGQLENLAVRGIGNLENSLLGLMDGTKSAKDAFRDMASSIVADLARIYIQQQITGVLAGALSGLFTPTSSSSGGGSGTTQQVMLTDSFDGGGYTGSGARTGGLDGKGGFMAMLHPNETVIDHTKGQSTGGVTIVQNIQVSTGVQQTVRTEIASLMPQIANASKQAVLDARRRGGSFATAFGA